MNRSGRRLPESKEVQEHGAAPRAWNRRALSDLGREELISRAKTQGIPRPELLTRVELVDELLRRTVTEPSRQKAARGLFGRARDLIAEVVEKGLHLPEAAEKIRSLSGPTSVPIRQPVATVTLAQIYAAQGHRDRAIDVLDQVLAAEPDHAAAAALRTKLLAEPAAPPAAAEASAKSVAEPAPSSSASPPPPARTPEPKPVAPPVTTARETSTKAERAPSMLDDAPLPRRYDVDEAVVLPVEPTTAYVYWEVRPATLARAKSHQPGGRLVVRVTATSNEGGKIITDVRDIPADVVIGDYFLFGLPAGAILRAALGWLSAETLEALAVSPSLSTPRVTPAARVASTVVAWSPESSPAVVVSPPPPAIALSVALAQTADDATADRVETTEPLHTTDGRAPRRRVRVPGGSSDEWMDVVDDGPRGITPPGSSENARGLAIEETRRRSGR